MGFKRDINTIHCYVDLSQDGNNAMFNREVVHEKFSKEVGSCLKKYGLEYKIEPLGEMGGGAETLLEVLKFAWENKGLVGVVIVLIKMILDIPQYINRRLNTRISLQKPKVLIHLGLETKQDCVDENLGLRLTNLKLLNDEICNKLADKYPVFKFDQSFGLFICPRRFSIRYHLDSERQNVVNSYRLLRLFKSLQIRDNYYSTYTFTKWLFITRLEGELNIEGNVKLRKLRKKYYLLFSTRILNDYFR